MKKIVALVLCLALALSLATVAMAAAGDAGSTVTNVKEEGYKVVGIQNNWEVDLQKDFTKTTYTKKVVSGDTTTTTCYADKYVFASDEELDQTDYYACDASIADAKLVLNGSVKAFLSKSDLSAGTDKVVTKKIDGVDGATCGAYENDVYMIDGVAYKVENTPNAATHLAIYNGLFVSYDGTETAASHDFEDKNVTTNATGVVTAIKCDACGKSFTVVKAGNVPSSYIGAIDETTLASYSTVSGTAQAYIILLGTTTSGSTGSDNVTSAETFDAGIAVYAGMALASVAGSAVVIGKKKEF